MSEVAEKTALEIWDSLMIDCGTEEENHQQIDRIAAIIQRATSQLEHENAALREKMKVSWDEISALVNQNCALREDKVRLDSIKHGWRFSCEEGSVGYPDNWFIWTEDWSKPLGSGPDIRAAIDAARKEAQP